MTVDRDFSGSSASRTRPIIIRLVIALVGVYVALALVLRRPLRALLIESLTTLGLWSMYAGRFAFDHPWMIALEVGWFGVWDRLRRPQREAVVFTGSSTVAHWTTLEQDMAPLPVINRGISGSRLHQIAYWANRLVVAYRPRAVVVYAGENDIAGFLWSPRHSPDDVLVALRSLCESVHARLPRVPIYFVSMKPRRRPAWVAPALAAGNELIQAYCASDERLRFVDVVPSMLDANRLPRADIFEPDGVHLNGNGYRVLTSVVRQRLLQDFER